MISFRNFLREADGDKIQPKDRDELIQIIGRTILKEGKDCDLNFIDTSKITDMSAVFNDSDFVGDISKWNVSNVRNMNAMFNQSFFNGDISG